MHRRQLVISCLLLCGLLSRSAVAQDTPPAASRPQPATEAASTTQPRTSLDVLLALLGDDDYRAREAATQHLLTLGEEIGPALRERLERETDPEVRFRLRFIIENIAPPEAAVLVIRGDLAGLLQPGDLITHVNNRRVGSVGELRERARDTNVGYMLRARGPGGPREVGPLSFEDGPALCDYQAPRGATIAAAVYWYNAGYAERAHGLLSELEGPVPEVELSPLLRAVIAYTAGDVRTASRLLATHPDACQPLSPYLPWSSPSSLDLAGPGKAPFYMEWQLWNHASATGLDGGTDPDIVVQRVLVPAGRYAEALAHVADMWWTRYRGQLGGHPDNDRIAGNLLAVGAWMLSEMDLVSECLRLIEPRSQILRTAPQSVRKWVRVRTDAWLAFLRGDAQGALNGFYEDARAILQPPGPPVSRLHIQNPQVAAEVAFFLYACPEDERTADMLSLVNHAGNDALGTYAHWMLYALHEENAATVHSHLLQMLPNVADENAPALARAAVLLEYALGTMDPAVLAAARERLGDCPDDPQHEGWLAMFEALEHLAAERIPEAQAALARAAGLPGAAALRSTAEFAGEIGGRPGAPSVVRGLLLAVPLGRDQVAWLVLTRGRQLLRFESATGAVTPVDRPSLTWFPGPLNWPWLGYTDEGRAYICDRRRIVEVRMDDAPPLVLNIATEDLAAFDQDARPALDALAPLLAAVPVPTAGEMGEYWRQDLVSNREFVADPDLPEIGLLQRVPRAPDLVHVAIRGGPHVLLDRAHGRAWTSPGLAEELGLDDEPHFLVHAAPPEGDGPATVVFLISDQGLIRLDVAAGTLTRVPLPGDEPYTALVPEWCPYNRRDPRWVYCARLPVDGGQVYRVRVADNDVEALEMVNVALPREYYMMQSRALLRAEVDGLLNSRSLPALPELLADVERTVERYMETIEP
ncbi:MAG: hypothetical protein PVJ57_04155 [Phycisphaerae bacterium]|jgi:hypothetical protein